MKKLLLILLIILMSVSLTYGTVTKTTNLELVKPAAEDTSVDWFDTMNDNMDLIDSAFDDPLEFDDNEKVEDRAGAMWTGNTETFITLTYQDTDNTVDAVVPIKDEDNMVSNSATFLCTQQSIKSYADTLHALQYLKTEIDTQVEVETIWGVTLATDIELAALTYSDVGAQQLDATLTAVAGLTIGANELIYGTGVDAFSMLGVNATATNKFLRQVSSGVPAWATLEAGDIPDISATYQPLDTALTNISALAYVSPSLIKLTANDTYAVRTFAEVKTDLAYQLSDMSDVGDTTLTDTYVLVADGDSFESRALVEADISDLGTYLEDITGESIFDLSDVTANPDADKYPKWDYDPGELVWVDATGFTDLTDFDEQTAWRLFYSNADGDVTELALGDDNTYLMSNGASAAPTFETPAGGGTVTTSGTPEVNDIARFTGATVIEGLTYDELTTALALNSDDLSDVASIAMLDEAETIPGDWTFLDYLTVQRTTDNPTLSASIYFEKIRDGTPTSDVSSGDELGRFVFTGYHTGFYHDAAKISALVDGDPGANDMPGRLEFFTTPDDSDTPVLRKTIDSSGNHKMGDGAWTNYVNTTAGGVMTAEGTATITATNLVPKQEIDFGAHSAGFTQQTLTGDGATLIDWTIGNKVKITLDGQNEAVTFTDPSNPCNLIMVIVQDDPGSRTITWTDMTIKWAGGTEPTLTTTADGEDIVSFYFDGTDYYGVASLAFATP